MKRSVHSVYIDIGVGGRFINLFARSAGFELARARALDRVLTFDLGTFSRKLAADRELEDKPIFSIQKQVTNSAKVSFFERLSQNSFGRVKLADFTSQETTLPVMLLLCDIVVLEL